MRRPILWAGGYAVLATIAAAALAIGILGGSYRAVERSDFVTYQTAGLIVLHGDGACLYTAACQAAAQHELIGDEPSFAGNALPFTSPPWLAAMVAPLATLPLPAAFAVFTLLGVAVLAWGTWRVASDAGWAGAAPRLLAVILVLTAWPTAMAVIRGQSTLLAVGLLGLSVGSARYRSGLALGLSALKPTLGPAWAAWQLLRGHWRAVGTAAATVACLAALTAVVVSPQAVADYPAYLAGIVGGDTFGIHPAEMVNWRGAAERLGAGGWLVVAGSAGTLVVVAITWLRTASRRLGAAAAFLATPLVLPHANQHEFVLAALGIVLALAAVPDLRRRLATLAVGLHAVLWLGVLLDARAAAWLLFAAELAWLVIVLWLALRQPARSAIPKP